MCEKHAATKAPMAVMSAALDEKVLPLFGWKSLVVRSLGAARSNKLEYIISLGSGNGAAVCSSSAIVLLCCVWVCAIMVTHQLIQPAHHCLVIQAL